MEETDLDEIVSPQRKHHPFSFKKIKKMNIIEGPREIAKVKGRPQQSLKQSPEAKPKTKTTARKRVHHIAE